MNEITGSEVLYVNNGETASFKWQFNFPESDIFLLTVNTEGSTLPAIIRKTQNSPAVVNSKNAIYYSRVQVSKPPSVSGIVIDINNIAILDENVFVCSVIFVDQSADVTNKTRLIVVGKITIFF